MSIMVTSLGLHAQEGQLSDCQWTYTSSPVLALPAGAWPVIPGMITHSKLVLVVFASQESPASLLTEHYLLPSLYVSCVS